MKAQLKNTQMVEVDLPEYFSYTLWSSVHYCRVMGDKIVDVTTNVFARTAESVIIDLSNIEVADFFEITKQQLEAKLNEVVGAILAEPATESN